MAQAVVSVFLAVISVFALIGNILVVILFVKNRQWLKKAHSCLLLALAIQDILTAVGLLVLPGFVQGDDVYDPPADAMLSQLFCSVVWSRYIPFALAIASVYTCLMLTFDRWFAAIKPMYYRRYSNSPMVIAALVVVPWMAGIGLEISAVLNVSSIEVNGTNVCIWKVIEPSAKKTAGVLLTFFGMIMVPAVLITIAYAMIVIKLRRSSAKIRPVIGDRTARNSSIIPTHNVESFLHLKKLTRVASAASTIVIVCWLPDQLYYCLFQLDLVQLGTPLHDGLVILAFTNTVLNPVIYSFSNKQYKEAFEEILCCNFRGRQAISQTQLNESAAENHSQDKNL